MLGGGIPLWLKPPQEPPLSSQHLLNSEPESLATEPLVPICLRIVRVPCVWGELFTFFVLDVAKKEQANNSIFILKEFGRLYLASGVTNEHSHVYDPYWKRSATSSFFPQYSGLPSLWGEYFVQLLICFSVGLPKFWSWAVLPGEWMNPL